MEKVAELIEEGHGTTWNKCLETLIENGKLNPEAVMDKQ
jgi:site-specific DNA-cytosine methylase